MRRATAIDLVALTALCAVAYLPGILAFPVANAQEAFRLLAAQDMQRSGEWLIPTHFGEPYLAKPPFFYWMVILVAEVRGAAVSLLDVRLVVAIAAWLGVLLTYGLAGALAGHAPRRERRSLALWSAAILAVGVLTVRSARIGELDVLLIPQIVAAVWLIDAARRHAAERGRTHWPAVAGAALATTAAALTKGPPPLAVVLVAAYLPPVAAAAWGEPRRRGPTLLAAAGGALLFAGVGAWRTRGVADALGALMLGALGALVGSFLAAGLRPAAARRWLGDWRRTHPLIVLGVPLLALWGWGRSLWARLDPEVVARYLEVETTNNLLVLIPESPFQNLGAMLYGVAPLGPLMVVALWSRSSGRVRWLTPALWCVGGFVVFSTLGKGVARYLTPLWPAVAILAAMGVRTLLAAQPDPGSARRLRGVLAAVLVLAAVVQTAWYAVARPRLLMETTPVALAAELAGRADLAGHDVIAVDAQGQRLACELDREVADWYWRHFLERHAELARVERPTLLVIRGKDDRPALALEALRAAGIEAEAVAVEAVWRRRSGEGPAVVLRVAPPPVP